MTTVTLSSKGQLVLPAEVRQHFGLVPGSQLKLVEEADGIRLIALHLAPPASVESGYGMFKPRSRGKPRRLADFDAATMVARAKP